MISVSHRTCSPRRERESDPQRESTDLGTLTDVVLVQECPRLVRVPDILERLGRVPTGFAKENLISSRVLFVTRQRRQNGNAERSGSRCTRGGKGSDR